MNQKDDRLILVGVLLLVITQVLILLGAYLGGLLRTEKNCWDKYPTEQQAIENCEGQN